MKSLYDHCMDEVHTNNSGGTILDDIFNLKDG